MIAARVAARAALATFAGATGVAGDELVQFGVPHAPPAGGAGVVSGADATTPVAQAGAALDELEAVAPTYDLPADKDGDEPTACRADPASPAAEAGADAPTGVANDEPTVGESIHVVPPIAQAPIVIGSTVLPAGARSVCNWF